MDNSLIGKSTAFHFLNPGHWERMRGICLLCQEVCQGFVKGSSGFLSLPGKDQQAVLCQGPGQRGSDFDGQDHLCRGPQWNLFIPKAESLASSQVTRAQSLGHDRTSKNLPFKRVSLKAENLRTLFLVSDRRSIQNWFIHKGQFVVSVFK